MRILKFGGTSVGAVESIRNVKNIVLSQPGEKILVLSAMAGVTNELVKISDLMKAGNLGEISKVIDDLRLKHELAINELIQNNQIKQETNLRLNKIFGELENTTKKTHSETVYSEIVTFGETILTIIFSQFLKSEGINNQWLDAKEFMYVSNLENPDTRRVGELFEEVTSAKDQSDIYITQGFVCINKNNQISTLKRGGSDYTATILGASINAKEVQIWTDIDGFHNNDPRYVENTHRISELSFEEAAELAYFGAKILHPQTISPVMDKNIPIYLKNTFTPESSGTRISPEVRHKGLKAISAKDGITAIKIKSNRMLMAHGFLRKIFDVFDNYETAIDMITTSEIAISLTIDDDRNLNEILAELDSYAEITVEKNHSIICVVGESVIEDKHTYRLFELLNDIPVRMISYGGSSNNISLLVDTENKIATLRKLNEKLFSTSLISETA
ncbi:aspartate kinase [Autumnicola musiva]